MPPTRYLLDTSVYSQPLRRQRVEAALAHWERSGDALCAVSAVTPAEVEWGLYKLSAPRLWKLYETVLRPRLVILPTDGAVWSRFAEMKATQAALGRPIPDLDLLIAATAVHHGLHLATLNLRHFQLIQGLRVDDWSVP